MRLSTRLLLPLLVTVTLVMLGYGWWSLQQRESFMLGEAERETRAYATALGLALERAVGQSDPGAVQEMIDRIDRDPNIYGVVVYDTEGTPRFISSPLARTEPTATSEIRAVLDEASVRVTRRELDNGLAVSVLRPLVDEAGAVHGVLEVLQPLSSLETQLDRTRVRFALNTVTLIVAVTLLMTWLVRRHLSEPLARFVEAVRTLGAGDLSYRLQRDRSVGELAEVGAELNRMADRLQDARASLVAQADERVSLERRLHQSEKLAEVGRLAAGLAHEIGAPLNVIRGRADLALRNEKDRDRNLRIIVGQIDRIASIVRSLLGYARRRTPRSERCDLVTVVRGVTEFVEVEFQREGVRLDLEYDAEGLLLWGDPDLLHQLCLNVVLNALHALSGSSDGSVVVRVGSEPGAEGAAVAFIEVEDNGPGIPAAIRERVFEPFFTTKDGSHGTGLGLALARGIAEDHGGRITLVPASADRWRTRVRIELSTTGPLERPASPVLMTTHG